MKPDTFCKLSLCGLLAVATLAAGRLDAQHLTLEGQTGGFLTPTAYVVPSQKGHILSHPAFGYHFIGSSAVIGNVHTFSVVEGFGNRAEVGYTRSVHTKGNSPMFSQLWDYSGMNVFHGKAIVLKEGTGGELVPGIAVGGVIRTGDHFVSGYLNHALSLGADTGYTNGDAYVVATKSWLKKPVPLLLNFGLKFTNASIFGIGGQSTRFSGRLFGGLGIPLPITHGIVAVPSVGFTQEPRQVKNLAYILAPFPGSAHIPTTMDYAVRFTQKTNPHFSADIGVGHVAGVIGTTAIPMVGLVPVDLQANKVVGMGLSFRY